MSAILSLQIPEVVRQPDEMTLMEHDYMMFVIVLSRVGLQFAPRNEMHMSMLWNRHSKECDVVRLRNSVPTFLVSWLKRKADRLSFRFQEPHQNPASSHHRHRATTSIGSTQLHSSITPYPPATQLRRNVLRPRRLEGVPRGCAGPGLPSDSRCMERTARFLPDCRQEERCSR